MPFIAWCKTAKGKDQVSILRRMVPFLIMWEIWLSKNAQRFDNIDMNAGVVIAKVCKWLREINATIKPKKTLNHLAEIPLINLKIAVLECVVKRPKFLAWILPPKGMLKLNADGSSLGTPGSAGAGGVLRDNSGKLIYAYSINMEVASNTLVEIQALKYGLFLCYTLSLTDTCVESDSQLVVNRCKNKTKPNIQFHRGITNKYMLAKELPVHIYTQIHMDKERHGCCRY